MRSALENGLLASRDPGGRPHCLTRKPSPGGARWLTLLALAALPLTSACSTRNDPGYNRYAPTNGDPTVLRRIEMVGDTVDEALDNLDERIENTVY